jgi:hypothetical protein
LHTFITMNVKRKIIVTILLALLCAVAYYLLPLHRGFIPFYDHYVYYPFQSFRDLVFGIFPFSLGDICYVVAGACLLAVLIKWIVWLFRFREHKERLAASLLNAVNTVLLVYLFFIIGWGANYYKPSLNEYWKLGPDTLLAKLPKADLKLKIKNDLVAFDTFLVIQLNSYAPHYHSLPFREINKRTTSYYHDHTDSRLKKYGLGVKPTFFGYFMERLAVEGYYNPFTGEGQVDKNLPSFSMPFLISHEIAHQAGIAAEGDANLMAYALCTASGDSTFQYSAYLEIWLYTNRRLYYRDSATALRLEKQLNKLTTAHLDTLEQLARKYDNEYARYSSALFDSYLKMQDQKEGIKSYGNVSSGAWELEKRRSIKNDTMISIP